MKWDTFLNILLFILIAGVIILVFIYFIPEFVHYLLLYSIGTIFVLFQQIWRIPSLCAIATVFVIIGIKIRKYEEKKLQEKEIISEDFFKYYYK